MQLRVFFLCLVLYSVSADRIIPFRQFSSSPSLGRGQGTSLDPINSNYGALKFFLDKSELYTTALGPEKTVRFTLDNWSPTTGCSVIMHVGEKPGCLLREAAYDSGGFINPYWGFIYNSVPFGLNFQRNAAFLYSAKSAGNENGLQLAQRLLDLRGANVKILPVLGSPRQSSGYLQFDVGVEGLEKLCKAGWIWRFLPPAENIMNLACSNLVGTEKNISFVTSIPGLSVLGGVQTGGITAFEFAAGLDNFQASVGGFFPPPNGPSSTCQPDNNLPGYNPPPQCYQNPGHKGLRFIHYPAWHQPYFTGILAINKGIWQSLDTDQQHAIEQAAKDSFYESYEVSNSVECLIGQQIVDFNDGQVQLNPDGSPKDCQPELPGIQPCSADMKIAHYPSEALTVLQQASNQYLDSLLGEKPDINQIDTRPDNQKDYDTILTAYRNYLIKTGFKWTSESGFPNCIRD